MCLPPAFYFTHSWYDYHQCKLHSIATPDREDACLVAMPVADPGVVPWVRSKPPSYS